MDVYYLNNFVLLKHSDGTEEPVRLKTETLTLWVETIIERIVKLRLLHKADNHKHNFDHNNCFYKIIFDLEDMLTKRNIHNTAIDIILKVLISNKDVLISVSQLNKDFTIDMIEGRLVLIIY